ncbi:MAG TPA: NADP-dependent oxidoreductase [Acidimicrobiia bacterium]|nr:NADP-dependent oxidoreductase [Acidimicrobiia bacterium]
MRTEHWVLARPLRGLPQPDDFDIQAVELPQPGEGQLLVANLYLSVDSGVRDRLGRDSYSPRAEVGEVIDGFAVGEVLASNHEKFQPGDLVSSGTGWRRHFLSDGKGLLRLDPAIFSPPIPITTAIGVLGVSGLTAYFGLHRVGRAWPGETVLISSAAGTVGATAGQIARINGCKVVGIAGGDTRCRYVVEDLGFDACVDRFHPDLAGAIADACLEGVDVYFDNVGGELLDVALVSMNRGGRIAVAGQVSEYNREEPRGVRNIREVVDRRLRLEGFVVWDFLPDFRAAVAEMAEWIREGKLTYREHVVDGFEKAAASFCDLFTGATLGRSLVRL